MSHALSSRQERWLLSVLASIQFTHILDFMVMMPLGPQLMRLFGISPQQFAYVVSSYTFSAGISGFLSAYYMDRHDRKKVLFWVYAGFILGTFSCAFAPTYPLLLAARILTGAFGGILSSVTLSIVADTIPYERRSRAMGKVVGAFSLAAVIGVPMGLYIASQFGWHYTFIFLAILGCVIMVAIHRHVPALTSHIRGKEHHVSPMGLLMRVCRNWNQVKALTITFFQMMGQFMIVPFISPYMVFNVGFKESQLTYIYLIGGAASYLASAPIGRLSDRFGNFRVFMWASFLCAVPMYLMTHMHHLPIPLVLVVTASFFVLVGGRIIPMMTIVTSTATPSERGGLMSLNSCVQQVSAGFAALFVGWIVTRAPNGELQHYGIAGVLSIVSCFLGVIVARYVRKVT